MNETETTPAIADKWALFTSSSAKDARACKRLYFYRHELGYRPVKEDEVLFFGSLTHLGLEAWFREIRRQQLKASAEGWSWEQLDQEAWLDAALAAVEASDADPYDRAKAQVMLTGYHLRWKDEPLEVLHVEERFEIALVNPATGASSRTWRLAGKVDVMVRDLRDGLVKLIEHKTSAEDITVGSDYWKRLRLDGQVSNYFDGGSSLVPEPVGECIFDVLFKPALRPSTTIPVLDEAGVKIVLDSTGARVRTKDGKKWRETASTADGFVLQVRDETVGEFQTRLAEAVSQEPEKYFARGSVVRLDGELDEHRFDSWQIAKEVHEYRKAGRFPRNPDACVRYGRTCPFFDVCTGAASLQDQTRFIKREVHPELAPEPAADAR